MVVRLAVLDLVGTTVADDGMVLEAIEAALCAVRVSCEGPRAPALRRQAVATMDRATLAVFGELLDGDMYRARRAESAFAARLRARIREGGLREVPGATAAIAALRDSGVTVALCSGFDAELHAEIVDALGWADAVDLAVCPADAGGRGAPDPAMLLAAARRGGAEPAEVVAAGDATALMVAARRAGAGLAVGVLSGVHRAGPLRAAGAHALIDSVTDLPALLGLPS